MGNKSSIAILASLALVALEWNPASATTISPASAAPAPLNLKLVGVGPTGTVGLTDANYSYNGSTYNNLNVYAGVLQWTDDPTSWSPDYYSFCVDIQSVIYIGSTYSLVPQTLTTTTTQYNSSALLFSPAVVNAIDNLWEEHPTVNAAVTGYSSNYPGISGETAAKFQVALWDIIYNDNGNGSFGSSLKFSGDNCIIDTAHKWATTAAGAGTSSFSNVGVLVATDGSQNQSYYLSGIHTDKATGIGTAVSIVPLPRSSLLGFALLGTIGLATGWWRIRNPQESSPSF